MVAYPKWSVLAENFQKSFDSLFKPKTSDSKTPKKNRFLVLDPQSDAFSSLRDIWAPWNSDNSASSFEQYRKACKSSLIQLQLRNDSNVIRVLDRISPITILIVNPDTEEENKTLMFVEYPTLDQGRCSYWGRGYLASPYIKVLPKKSSTFYETFHESFDMLWRSATRFYKLEWTKNVTFDVFLSHNSQDKPLVRELVQALKSRGLMVWLDDEQLVPGRPWQKALETTILTTRSVLILVGNSGLSPWGEEEMRASLGQHIERQPSIIPVLLPNAPKEPELPPFLRNRTWVDLRGGLTSQGIDKLEWGITGEKPG